MASQILVIIYLGFPSSLQILGKMTPFSITLHIFSMMHLTKDNEIRYYQNVYEWIYKDKL